MSTKSLTVVAQLKAKPGNEAQVREILLSAVAPSRKDAGCLNYDLHQGQDDPSVFVFHENWTSKAHLEQHLAKPELKAILGKIAPLLLEPPQILLLDKIQ